MSSPESAFACSRKLSRAIRFTLFRATAPRSVLRERARPRRGCDLLFRAANTTNWASLERRAVLKTASNSAEPLNLCLRWKRRERGFTRPAAFCLWPGAPSGSAARLCCACGRENRERASA